ncbi:MAG: patatin-like phospholipase family protein [Proteobacteria bacterium]|nr:patatin-like phospholipase family protein [Pseudomonadota bacterium]MBU1581419.1 patatin-like phospholipase family protein [Pseudomonadota bacterium]MBU2631784.1 patatin-like phospholipase family protein [Pseudomonadota bacterium]
MKRALIFAGGGSRGSFQIGVWKYLTQRNWKPDIICGTSVGAINAVGIASDLDIETLTRLWTTYGRRKMYRLNLIRFLAYLLSGRAVKPLLDTRPMQSMVLKHLDFNALKKSLTKVVISAVNIHTAKPVFFDNHEIALEHVLASSAIPILFPWHTINGVPHWDGGIMTNIPLQPALDFGADEIIIVLLSPVSHTPQPFPKTLVKAVEHVLEQFLASPYQSTLTAKGYRDMPLPQIQPVDRQKHSVINVPAKQPRIITLAPAKMLGFRSLLNFSLLQARQLIDEGYKTAYTQLKPFI